MSRARVVVGEGRPSGLLSQTLDFALDNAPTLAGTRMLYPRLRYCWALERQGPALA